MPIFEARLDPNGILTGADAARRGIRGVGDAFDDMQNRGTRAVSSLDSSLARLGKTLIGIAGAYKAVDLTNSFVAMGIAANESLESTAVGLSAVINATMDLRNAQGALLEGQEKYAAALALAGDVSKQVDAATKSASASELQLMQALQASMGVFSSQGKSIQENIAFLSDMSNAMEAFKLDVNDLGKEATNLLTGKNLSQSAFFSQLKNLGVSEDDVRSWVKAGTVIDNVADRLEAFGYASETMANTYRGATKDLASSLDGVAQVVTGNLTNSLKEGKAALSSFIYTMNGEKVYELTESIKPLVGLAEDVASAFGDTLRNGVYSFTGTLESAGKFVQENREGLNFLGSTVRELTGYVDDAVIAYGAWGVAKKMLATQTGAVTAAVLSGNASLISQTGLVVASTQGIQRRALVEHEAAVATLERARAEYAEHEIAMAGIGITNQQVAAYQRLIVAERAVAVTSAQVVAANEAVAAAQARATATARGLAAAQALGAKAAQGIGSLVTMLGGPWVVGLTAAAAGIYAIATADSAAEKAAKSYGTTLEEVTDRYKKLRDAADDTAESTDKLTESHKDALKKRLELDIANAKEAIEDARKKIESVASDVVRVEIDFYSGEEREEWEKFDNVKKEYRAALQEIKKAAKEPGANIDELRLRTGTLLDTIKKDAKGASGWFGGIFNTAKKETNLFSAEVQAALTYLDEMSKQKEGLGKLEKSLNNVTASAKGMADGAGAAVKELMKLSEAQRHLEKLDVLFGRMTLSLPELNAKLLTKELDEYQRAIDSLVNENKLAEASVASLNLAMLRTGAEAAGADSLQAYVKGREDVLERIKKIEMGEVEYKKFLAKETIAARESGLQAERNALVAQQQILQARVSMAREATIEELEIYQRQAEAFGESVAKIDAALDAIRTHRGKLEKDLAGGGSGGSGGSFDASKAYKSATKAAEQLRLKQAELQAQWSGSSLDSTLKKITHEYEAQGEALRKQQEELEKSRAQYVKAGKLDTYAETLKEIEAQKEILAKNQAIEESLARRAALESELKATADYAGQIGDLKAMHAAQVDLLNIEMQRAANAAEHAAIQEQIRVATARRDGDVLGMMQTGFMDQSKQAQQGYIDFFEKDIPGAFASTADAFGKLSSEVAFSSKTTGNALKDLGNSASKMLQQLYADFTSTLFKIGMFGNSIGSRGGSGGMGGLVGMLGTAIGSMLGGGGGGGSSFSWGGSAWSGGYGDFTLATVKHTGGVAGVDNAVTRIVPSEAFSGAQRYHTGGVAGMRSGEVAAILNQGEPVFTPAQAATLAPLSSIREAARMGNAMTGMAGMNFQPVFNVAVQNNTSVPVDVQQKGFSQDGNGRFNMEWVVNEVDSRLAQRVTNGTSRTGMAMDRTRNLNRASALYRK